MTFVTQITVGTEEVYNELILTLFNSDTGEEDDFRGVAVRRTMKMAVNDFPR